MNGATVSSSQLQLSAGQQQYLTLGPFSTGSVGLTFSCWFRSSSSGSQARIFDFGNGQKSDNIVLSLVNNNLQLSVFLQAKSTIFNTGINLNNNQWYHVTWVLSPSVPWQVYVDGTAVTVAGSVNAFPRAVQRSSNFLGKSNWPSQPYFNGAIRDFRTYQRDLSPSEAYLLYETTQVNKSSSNIYCLVHNILVMQ